jgi:hypothetical protein
MVQPTSRRLFSNGRFEALAKFNPNRRRIMDRNGEDWTGDDISEKASAPSGARDDASGDAPADADETSDTGTTLPPESGEPDDFRPEGAEFEPAGGIVKKPPVPEQPDDAPTEGDRR